MNFCYKTRDNFQISKSAKEHPKRITSQHEIDYHDCGHFATNFKENLKNFAQSSRIHSTDDEEFDFIVARTPRERKREENEKRNQKFKNRKKENSYKLSNSKNAREKPVPAVIAIEKVFAQQDKIGLPHRQSKRFIEPSVEITSEHLLPKKCLVSTQMGFDIISRLRQLLSFNPPADQQPIVLENNLKRRPEDPRELYSSQCFKYRKVYNEFPRYIANTAGDNIVDVLPSSDKLLDNREAATNSKLSIMSLPQSVTSVDKPNFRKSTFVAPKVTRIFIKNSNDCSIELSDYDEFQDELVAVNKYKSRIFEEKQSTNNGKASIMQRVKPTLKLTNPTTIIENNRLTVPEKRNGYGITGRNSIHKCVPSNKSLEPSRILNGLDHVPNAFAQSRIHSILLEEKKDEERLKYQQLLQKVMPHLYGDSNESGLPQNFVGINQRNPLLRSTATQSVPSISRHSNQCQLKRRPLMSSFDLDDDEVEDNTIIAEALRKTPFKKEKIRVPIYVINDDKKDKETNESIACKGNSLLALHSDRELSKICKKSCKLPQVAKVNSFQEHVECVPSFKDDWLENFEAKWALHKFNRRVQCNEAAIVSDKLQAERRATENEVLTRLGNFKIIDVDLMGVDDSEEPVPEAEFVELTSDQRMRINTIICGPPDQVLVSKYNLNITRRDIHTLCGHNWLNDEIINFYMNLLTERGDKKHKCHGMPKVYAMNTFFVPRLMQAGYAGVKRWTRKVDIFTKDIIPVPVHVDGVHWCMAIIHFKQNSIKYYDSLGTPNPNVLKALEQYLKDESWDKHKQAFDTTGFNIESVTDVPRQTNGSDCGVFSCMFAEYITRNRQITFTQQNMEFFRQKMILEIIQGELME